jgi:hypothetical protein
MSKMTLMTQIKRPVVVGEIHRRVKAYAAEYGISVPQAYEELLKKGLERVGNDKKGELKR